MSLTLMMLLKLSRLKETRLLAKTSTRCYSKENKQPAIRANVTRRKHHEFEPFPFAITPQNKDITVRRAVEPLFDVSYEEQLALKESYCKKSLRAIARELYQLGTPIRLDVRRLPCHFNPIVRSPVIERFRTKEEYSLWKGYDGITETVGFTVFPLGKHGNTVCIEPDSCQNPKIVSIEARKLLQEFIISKRILPICYSLGEDSGWRRFATRANNKDELMIIGQCSPRGLRVQQLVDEKENFRSFMVEQCEKSNLKLASLYFQACPHGHCSYEQAPFELLHGEQHLKDEIAGLTIYVSPESYMPDNTAAAEKLYEAIRDTMDECFPPESTSRKPLIIDLNCGIGMLALSLADKATKVVGVDIRTLSISDAQLNAQTNGIENCDFFCTNPEIAFEKILEKYKPLRAEPMVVSLVNANGMHKFLSQSLRECADIKKLLYISTKIGSHSVMRDMITLCEKKSGKVPPPFIPVSATPVDVLPNSEACNLILVMERLPK